MEEFNNEDEQCNKKRKFEDTQCGITTTTDIQKESDINQLITIEKTSEKASELPILYQDEDVVIIDKPPNVRLYASEHYSMETIEKMARIQFSYMLLGNCPNNNNNNNNRQDNEKTNSSETTTTIVEDKDSGQKKRKLENCRRNNDRKIRFPHRLDMATSGVLCLSMTRESCSCLSSSFEDKTSKKFYLALLNGHVNVEELKSCEKLRNNVSIHHHQRDLTLNNSSNNNGVMVLIKSFIGRDDNSTPGGDQNGKEEEYDPTGRGYMMKQVLKKPAIEDLSKYKTKQERQQHQFREGITEMRIVSFGHVESTKPVTLVLLRPLSGRKHQLRLHSLLIGHSIVGDEMYGVEPKGTFTRLMLHAYSLNIPIMQDKEYLLRNDSNKKSDVSGRRTISVKTVNPFEKFYVEKEVLIDHLKLVEITEEGNE